MNRLPRLKWSVIFLLLVAMCQFFPQPIAQAYYGGLLSSLNPYYGLDYGLGLFGMSSLYSPYSYLGFGSGYGLTGLYGGLYGGSLYGGLYGGSLYGGLYGGGLYGGMYGGMYGGSLYGGMYGGGLYGGLYGGGLYGGLPFMGNYYGLGRNYYSSGMESLTRNPAVLLTPTTGGGATLLPTTTTVAPTVTITIPIFPDPTGSYFGSWTSLLTSTTNPMTMTIAYNILTIGLTGTAGLLLNKLIPIAINVSGINNAPSFILSGTYFDILSLVTYTLELTCTYAPATLTLPAIIRGTYLIHDPLYLKIDAGSFSVGRL